MAKKKNQTRKHKFKYAEPTQSMEHADVTEPAIAGVRSVRPGVDVSRDFSYVAHDLKRIGITAVILILAEIILWFAMGNTGLGKSVYSLIAV